MPPPTVSRSGPGPSVAHLPCRSKALELRPAARFVLNQPALGYNRQGKWAARVWLRWPDRVTVGGSCWMPGPWEKCMTRLCRKIIKYLLLAIIWGAGVGGSLAAGGIFSWTDEGGIRHYSNVTPSISGKNVETFEEDHSRYQGLSRNSREGILFKAVKIYDGDSLKVSGGGLTLMVRLVGIDAPETGGGKHEPQPFSRKSKEAFSRMIAGGSFTLKSYGTGSYNRVLAELFVGSENVNLALLREGLAEVYQGKMHAGLDKKAYLKAQKEARQHRLGIWSLGKAYESPRLWRKKHPRK